MRRLFAWLLTALMMTAVCAGCGESDAGSAATLPQDTPSPTAAPTITQTPLPTDTPAPEGEPAVSRIDRAGVIFAFLSRGDTVSITGEQDDCFIVSIEGTETPLLVEKWLIRLDGAETPKPWGGYAKANTKVYISAYQEGEPIATLAQNTQVTVSDDLGLALFIEWGDGLFGYALPAAISRSPLGGGGGGSNGGADGGDIQLALRPRASSGVVRLANASGKGSVLSDLTEAYAAFLSRGDTISVIERDESHYHVLMDGQIGKVSLALLRLADEQAYAEWDGFSSKNAPFYGNFRMLGDFEKLRMNTVLRVLEDLGDRYLVSRDGALGFVAIEKVNVNKQYEPSGGGGGGGGGGEWTDPIP